jgi:hypothetical protein
MLAGRTPFSSADPNENDLSIFNRVMAFDGSSLTDKLAGISHECQDLIGQLLQPVDRNRISAQDEKLANLYHHPWFAMDGGVEWLAMHEASAVAPLASRCDAAARSAEKATAPIGSGGATVPASAWAQW